MEIRKIQCTGNTVYTALPKNWTNKMGLMPKDYVVLKFDGKTIIIKPLKDVLDECRESGRRERKKS